jgi:hypothetical protein
VAPSITDSATLPIAFSSSSWLESSDESEDNNELEIDESEDDLELDDSEDELEKDEVEDELKLEDILGLFVLITHSSILCYLHHCCKQFSTDLFFFHTHGIAQNFH